MRLTSCATAGQVFGGSNSVYVPAGWIIYGESTGSPPAGSRLLVSTMTPLKTADQAARLVWLTDNWPRVAFSLRVVVNRSSRCQSFVGWEKKESYQPTPVGVPKT